MATITMPHAGGDPIAILLASVANGAIRYPVPSGFYWGSLAGGGYYQDGASLTGTDLVYSSGDTLTGTIIGITVYVGVFDPWFPEPNVGVTITGLDWDAGAVMDVLTGRSTATLYDLVDATPWNWTGSAFADSFTGGRYADTLKGGGGNDTIFGALGNDTIDGGSGNDRMEGGLGDDRYLVDSAGDLVRELAGEGYDTVVTAGSYALESKAEIELLSADARAPGAITLTGNGFGQTIRGNGAANTLAGGGGADVLEGRGGSDVLMGNGPTTKDDGATDVFKFLAIDSGTATIWGHFSNGAAKFDKIDLSAIDANGAAAGNGAFEFIGTSKFGTGPEGQVRITATTDGYIVSLDTDTDTAAEMQFFVHSNTLLRAGDFIL